jgi:hypothetical protein
LIIVGVNKKPWYSDPFTQRLHQGLWVSSFWD